MSDPGGAALPQFQLLERYEPRVPYVHAVRARHAGLDREVELRILPGGLSNDVATLFFQELRDLSRLDHPAFLPVYRQLELKGRPAYLVPPRAGPPLPDVVHEPRFDIYQRAAAVRQLAMVWARFHAEGRFLGPLPLERLVWDFPTERLSFLHHKVTEEDWSDERLRHTPLEGGHDAYGTREDVFAWGLLAYSILSRGQHPYGAGPENLRALRRLAPEVAEGLASIVESTLAWEPGLRPRDGIELGALLRDDRVDASDAPPPVSEMQDMGQVSSRINRKLLLLRKQGAVDASQPGAPPPASPEATSVAAEEALGTPSDDDSWKQAAASEGLALAFDDTGRDAPRTERWLLIALAVVGLLLGRLWGMSQERPDAPPAPPALERTP